MTTQTGLVYQGERHGQLEVYDGREHIGVGHQRMWWTERTKGAYKRQQPIRGVILHHTGAENPAQTVHNTLWNRDLSVHFIVDQMGHVWQLADLETVTQHAGPRGNAWSVGVEIVSKGTAPSYSAHYRHEYRDELHGRPGRFLRFNPLQVGAVYDLCLELTRILGIPFRLPMDGDRVRRGVLSDAELGRYHGLLGHFHLTTRKVDPSPHLLDELAGRATLLPPSERPTAPP